MYGRVQDAVILRYLFLNLFCIHRPILSLRDTKIPIRIAERLYAQLASN